mgnify:FL=1
MDTTINDQFPECSNSGEGESSEGEAEEEELQGGTGEKYQYSALPSGSEGEEEEHDSEHYCCGLEGEEIFQIGAEAISAFDVDEHNLVEDNTLNQVEELKNATTTQRNTILYSNGVVPPLSVLMLVWYFVSSQLE